MNPEKVLIVLRTPHISEKSTAMADKFKQFTFKVLRSSTKIEIKLAVEQLFNVKVKQVATMNVKGKTKCFKRLSGRRSDWKKAIVSLEASYDIDFTTIE